MSALADTAPSPEPPPGAASAYAPGSTIADRYELVRLAGQGGVGQVWIARSHSLHNEVALKLFVRGGSGDGAERLLREARAAAALDHPGIVRVFDYGETQRGDPFLVMELLKGESLEELLARVGPLQAAQALRLLLPIIDGLSAAHAKKIVHRDVKPANLFLAVDDEQRVQPKLIDFGLARLQLGGQRVTQAGTLVGTPAYMSPEQVRDLPLDARTDIWSLSVALYELLTGRMPFDGETQHAMFRAILESPPAPIPITGDIDAGLVAIVLRGLAKDRADRWSSARELGVAFAKWLVGHGHEDDLCGASLQNLWLKPRKVSSLAPPTPAIAFVPPGLIAPLTRPSPQRAELAATLELPAEVTPPRRSRLPWILGALGAVACVVALAGILARASNVESAAASSIASTPRTNPPASAHPSVTHKPTAMPAPKPTATAPKLGTTKATSSSTPHK